jgi:glycosyltransferase involved in cell wall biosynthesis
MSEPAHSMVSCLMVTLPVPQRLRHFQRSLHSYCQQTHPCRELVIVLDQCPPDVKSAIAAHVSSLGRSDIEIVTLEGQHALGALRNLSLDRARGQFVCQWDDDDLHHPQRLELQLRALLESGSQAVCLQEVMQFFSTSRTLYCTNWHATEAKCFPGTLMCRKSAPIRYPESGPRKQFGEDTDVVLQLQRQGGLHILSGAPHLYVYTSHGENSYGDDHHRMLATRLGISRALLLRREAQLREGLRPFDFGPGDVTVQGYNGAAFTLGHEGGD